MDINADINVDAHAGIKIDDIIYDFKVMTFNTDLRAMAWYFIISARS